MRRTRKTTKQKPLKPYHPGFGTLGRDVDLSIGILIAECETGEYIVLGPVSTINEGIEIARHDHTHRLRTLDQGPVHVELYKVWARDYDGEYAIAFEIRERDGIL